MELRRRIIAPRQRRPDRWEGWDDGLDAYGNWPDEG